jgi:twinkle protein
MSSPDEINLALSERMDQIVSTYFPDASKSGASWNMGDLDGGAGKSTGIFRGKGGIYFAKDRATDETLNVLGLLHRALGGSWVETITAAKKMCGITDVKEVAPKPKPKKPSLGCHSMRGTKPYEYLTERGIQEHTMSKYQLRRIIRADLPATKQLRWNDEYIRFPYVDSTGDTVMYKWLGIERQDGKKEIGSTVPQYATLWGHWLVNDNTKQILITEGEIDAMSVDQMCPDVPTLSMPTGASNLDWINNDYERLQQFEKILILTDMDSAGESAAQKIAKRLGLTRCFRVSLPSGYNDANEFLLSKEHGKPDFKTLVDNAKTYDPQQLRSASDYSLGVAEEITRFENEQNSNNFIWPDLPFRFRNGEMTVVTGYPGSGKSQLTYQMVLHEMIVNERRVCIASFEIPAKNMLFNLLWMLTGRSPKAETIENDLKIFEDKLWFIESDEDNTASWNGLRDDFHYANRRFGCDFFIVDALMHITKKGDAEGTDLVAKQAAKFCVNNDSSMVLICHADAKKRGSDHIPEVEDVLGGQGIGGAAHNVMSVWRNKEKERETETRGFPDDEKCDGKIYISKQRSTGNTVFRDIWFNKSTRTFFLDSASSKMSKTYTQTNQTF